MDLSRDQSAADVGLGSVLEGLFPPHTVTELTAPRRSGFTPTRGRTSGTQLPHIVNGSLELTWTCSQHYELGGGGDRKTLRTQPRGSRLGQRLVCLWVPLWLPSTAPPTSVLLVSLLCCDFHTENFWDA